MNSSIILLFVVAILCGCSLLNKKAISESHPLTIQYIQCLLNVVLLPVWWFLSRKLNPVEITTKSTYFYALTAGLMSTVGFVLFMYALKDKPISVATAYLSTYPAVTMLVCAWLGDEKITIGRGVGVIAVLVGVVLIQLCDK